MQVRYMMNVSQVLWKSFQNFYTMSKVDHGQKIPPMEHIVQPQTLYLTAPLPTSKLVPMMWSISVPKLPPKKWKQGNL